MAKCIAVALITGTKVRRLALLSPGRGALYKLPQGVWGGAPAEMELGAFSLKIRHLIATILIILM